MCTHTMLNGDRSCLDKCADTDKLASENPVVSHISIQNLYTCKRIEVNMIEIGQERSK